MKVHGFSPDALDSIILVQGEMIFTQSGAALRIAKELSGLWPLLYAFIVVPPFLRNVIYDLVSRNRYRLFGKREECMIPTPELRLRFIQ
jgi:predicted DCC family thiol-disulfide oxidoreductase YuxK